MDAYVVMRAREEYRLLDATQPVMDDLPGLGWFGGDLIFDVPRQDWIDRVVDDCA